MVLLDYYITLSCPALKGEIIVLEKITSMIKNKDMAVLGTASEGKPYCSLMAYVCNDTGTQIYMVTYRNTQKYKNLQSNPAVSILIDTRDEDIPDRSFIKALTIAGMYEEVTKKQEKARIREKLLDRHPHLKNIIHHEDGEIFAITITSCLLLDGPTDAHFEKVS